MISRRFWHSATAFVAGLFCARLIGNSPLPFLAPAGSDCPSCAPCVQTYSLPDPILIRDKRGHEEAASADSLQRRQAIQLAETLLRRRSRMIPSIPTGTAMFADAILPLMRDWGCGHDNLEIPRILIPRLGGRTMEHERHGRGRIVVDVGLGSDAAETMQAVQQGFVVFSFDPDGGNIAQLHRNVVESRLEHKFYFVPIVPGKPPNLDLLPLPPPEDEGFAYVFFAGLGSKVGMAEYQGDYFSYEGQVKEVDPQVALAELQARKHRVQQQLKEGRSEKEEEGGEEQEGSESAVRDPVFVPLLTLDSCLPNWVDEIYFLKIDTQGYELNVLQGATKILQQGLVRYILFEYSPRLMEQGNLGNHTELLHMLPTMGYGCFDMTGEHLALPRASTPISKYQEQLLQWDRWGAGEPFGNKEGDRIGPWDDILCASFARLLLDDVPVIPTSKQAT